MRARGMAVPACSIFMVQVGGLTVHACTASCPCNGEVRHARTWKVSRPRLWRVVEGCGGLWRVVEGSAGKSAMHVPAHMPPWLLYLAGMFRMVCFCAVDCRALAAFAACDWPARVRGAPLLFPWGTWASRTRKRSEAGCGRPEDRDVQTAKTVKRPPQQPAQPQYANQGGGGGSEKSDSVGGFEPPPF